MATRENKSTAPSREDIFATTRWTVVCAAGQQRTPEAAVALEELCRTYWYPLYAYVRRHGRSKEDAEDLTQAFFAKLLAKNCFADLRRERGKFRALLLAALKHFLANEWDKTQRQKRGGGVAPLSLDWRDADQRYQIEPADNLSPDKLFDRAWAVLLLERVLARLRTELVAQNKKHLFEHLKPFLMQEKGTIPSAQAAAALKMTETATRVAIHRLRRRYRELLRDEIAQTLAHPAQLDEEMRSLFAAFQ